MTQFNNSNDLDKIVRMAKQHAADNNHQYFTVEHLLLSMLHEKGLKKVLESLASQSEQIK